MNQDNLARSMNMMKDQLKRADDRAKAAEKKVDVVFLFSFLFVFQEYFAEFVLEYFGCLFLQI